MIRILTAFLFLAAQAFGATLIPIQVDSTTRVLASPTNAWTANSAGIYNALGLGGMSLQSPSSVSITGGSISGITDLAIADGGTGASTASGARGNLGLTIGTDVQAYSLRLGNLDALTGGADLLPYFSGTSTWATTTLSAFGRSLIDDADAATARSTLGLGGASTLSVGTTAGTVAAGDDSRITGAAQKASNLSDLANAATARSNLGAASTAGTLAQFGATTSSQLAGVISDETGSGALVFGTSPTFTTPILGTPSQANLASATNLPISTGVSGLGSGVATALATPSSANIFAAVTDETGSGSLVGSANPTFTGTVGAATITATGVVTGSSLTASSNSGTIGWSDAPITRKAANSIQIGAADSAAPSAMTVNFPSVAAGTTDTAGQNASINLPRGTGTGAGGDGIIYGASASSTGSSQNALTERFRVRAAGGVNIGGGGPGVSPYLFPVAGASSVYAASGTALRVHGYGTGAGDAVLNVGGANFTATSGNTYSVYLDKNFAPTSGTATHAQLVVGPTINQTGGANGQTWGIYVNPTLTSDGGKFRAFEATAGDFVLPKTVTSAGTTGAQTINKITGSVNFAAAATSLVVTDSYCTANSIIIATVASNDTTMKSVSAVAGSGSFTLYANAAATAETRVNFRITN